MKGKFRIGGAVLVGVVMVLGAFYLRNANEAGSEGKLVVSSAPDRAAIQTLDSNGNGIEDWQESLEARIFDAIIAPTSTIFIDEEDGAYDTPDSFTGRFSEAFLQDYMEGKMEGADLGESSGIIANAVSAIETNTQSKKHSKIELTITETNGSSVHDYGNTISSILTKHSIKNENEAAILQRALTAEDPELLKPLDPIFEVYTKIIDDVLSTPVPGDLSQEHLRFINAAEAIRTDIAGMKMAFSDPLYTLARMRGYEDDAEELGRSLQAMAQKLDDLGVSYSKDEPGAVFYAFIK